MNKKSKKDYRHYFDPKSLYCFYCGAGKAHVYTHLPFEAVCRKLKDSIAVTKTYAPRKSY